MTISANYNVSELILNRNLSNATSALSNALNRMSTGFKVNSAADDAAGLYVATGMRTQINGLRQAQKNTATGINLLGTAQGALTEMNKILNRVRDLSVQASNGVYGKNEREAMQKEIDALTEQYNQIKKGTNFNGRYLFETPSDTSTTSTYAASLASRVSSSGGWKIDRGDAYSADTIKPPVTTPAAGNSAVPQAPEINNDQSKAGAEGEEKNELPENKQPEYDPSVQLTSKEMNALKVYIEAGGKYEDFSAKIASGMNAEDILGEIKASGTETAEKTSKARSTALAAEARGTAGTVDFSASETKVVTIGGVNYTIQNKQAQVKSLIWTKDDAGKITFEGSYFDISGASDVSHNIEITGTYMTIRGGDKNDVLSIVGNGSSINNTIYAGGGNDTVNALASAHYNTYFLESGDNTFNFSSSGMLAWINGGVGNNTFNLNTRAYSNSKNDSYILKTGDGNNIINFNSGATDWGIKSGNGNNTYNFNSTNVNGTLIIDKNGSNVINNTVNNVQTDNVIAGNFTINGTDKFVRAFSVDFAAGETKTTTLNDGKKYTITNRNSAATQMLWKMEGDKLTAVSGNNFNITALEKSKVDLRKIASVKYYCSSFGDEVTFDGGASAVYTGSSNNTISSVGGVVYCEGGDNNITIISGYIYAKEGNNTINIDSYAVVVLGGNGNNTYNINASYATVLGGAGNDTFNIKTGISNVSCIGGGGANTVTGNVAGALYLSDMSNAVNNATSFLLPANTTTGVDINIDGAMYTFKNGETIMASYGAYSIGVDGTVSIIGNFIQAKADSSKYHKIEARGNTLAIYGGDAGNSIISYGYMQKIYGGAGDDLIETKYGSESSVFGGTDANKDNWGNDTVTINHASYIYSGNGNNKYIINSTANFITNNGNNHYIINRNSQTFNGGNGNNIYEINGNNNNITGGTGKDTFIVNGNNNQAFGAAGDDYFTINSGASNSTIIGGTGENYIVDNGIDTTNPTRDVRKDPNSGILYFVDNITPQTLTLYGKTYIVYNNTTEATPQPANTLKYSYNTTTDEVTFEGDNLTITASDGVDHNVIIKGSGNVFTGGNGNDKVQILSGTKNKITGGNGNDTIVANTANNKLIAGAGNDQITVNSDNNYIEGTSGSNIININSNGNNIVGGSGQDQITVNGSTNTIDGGAGDDRVSATGNSNIINSSSGNDNLSAKGNNNKIVETGNNNNIIGIDGENNDVSLSGGNNSVKIITSNSNTVGNTVTTENGDNNFTVQGNKNRITSRSGKDSFEINGSDNIINGGDGNNSLKLNFGSNNTAQTGSGEDNIRIKSGNNNINTGAGNDSIYINGDYNKVMAGDGDDKFDVRPNANNNNIDGEAGKNTMLNYGNNTVYNNVRDITTNIDIRLQIGANSDANSYIKFNTDVITEDLLLDLSSAESAVESISLVDNIITVINTKRSEFGAIEARLNSVMATQQTQIENLAASVSTIMDADIAEESAIYVKNQILQQSCVSLISAMGHFNKSLILSLIQ